MTIAQPTIDRQDMERDLAEHLAGRDGSGLLPRSAQARLKTHVVEAHSTATLAAARERLEAAAAVDRADLQTTADPGLFLLTTTVRSEDSAEAVGFWVDTANPRFWLLHAKTKADATRLALRRLVSSNPRLDHAWLPRHQLHSFQHRFRPFGFRLGFDERLFYKGRDVADFQEPTHKLAVEHAGVGAEGMYELFETNVLTRRAMAVAEVSFWEHGEAGTQLMRVSRDGRLLSQGQSLDSHLGAAHLMLGDYERFVRGLERVFALRISEARNGDVVIEGQPLSIGAAKPEGFAFQQLVERMVSGVEPFRLLGSAEWISEDLAWVDAVDLHTATSVRIDITPDWVRMYLGAGLCGNTLARFVTNLQRSYNADLQALDEASQLALGPRRGTV
jgi:hypothetical protein